MQLNQYRGDMIKFTEGIGVKIVFTLWSCNSPTSLYQFPIISNRGITKQLGFLCEAKDEVKLSGHFKITAFYLELNDGRSFRTIEKSTIDQDNQLSTRNVTQLCMWLNDFWVRPYCKLLLFCMYTLSTSNVLFYSWPLQMTTVGPTNFNWFYKWREKYRYNLPVLIYLSKFPLFQSGALHFARASWTP